MRAPLLALLLLLPAARASAGGLEVRDAWIREAPPTAAVLAGYAELANGGDAPLRVVGASSAGFRAVELHEIRMDQGVMRMRALESVVVPARGSVRLAPGGDHLMLLDPARPLAAGDRVGIRFEVEGAAPVLVEFEVRRPR